MKKLLISFAMLCAVSGAQVPVRPIQQPHMTFVNSTGAPCAGCKLYSYIAGSTTPQATYIDSTGTSVNTNPIILGADGGANIWLSSLSYKLVLIDALGNTVWSVDNVSAASFPCAPSKAIQIANTAATGWTCDSSITIDPAAHTLNVGTLGANYVSIGALGTPTRWTFDTTTPATALASLGGAGSGAGTAGQLAYFAATGNVVAGTSAIPSAITATTQSPGDNTTKVATTAYVASPGAINPSSVKVASGTAMTGNQGNGTLVQHSTGAVTAGHAAKFDANGNIVDAGGGLFTTLTDVTGSFTFGTSYQNTGTLPLQISGYGTITGGSGDSMIMCNIGPSSPSFTPWSTTVTGTVSGEHVGFSCIIPPTYFYSVTVTNIISSTPGKWFNLQ